MNTEKLQRVALRREKIYIPDLDNSAPETPYPDGIIPDFLLTLLSSLHKCGYTLSEGALHALSTRPAVVGDFTGVFADVLGLTLNWTPLIKKWNVPGGYDKEQLFMLKLSYLFMPELFRDAPALPCGHTIPRGIVDLGNFNGCPLCGTPFEVNALELKGEGSRMIELSVMTEEDMREAYLGLYRSNVPLDASQREDLSILLEHFGKVEGEVPPVKENCVIVATALYDKGDSEGAGALLSGPREILRYLWFRHTGNLLLAPPSALIRRNSVLYSHMDFFLDRSEEGKNACQQSLLLHYRRKESRTVATWINNLEDSEQSICEQMHPNRGMWVRFIRALRLTEYAKKPGFDKLRRILDLFYREDYPVWARDVSAALEEGNAKKAFSLLRSRPGSFARQLFSLMLRLDWREVLDEFGKVLPEVPLRIVLSLYNTAQEYFWGVGSRSVNVPGVGLVSVPYKYEGLKDPQRTQEMILGVKALAERALREHFTGMKEGRVPPSGGKIFIEESLYSIPVPVSDRSDEIQDLSSLPQGSVFPLEGKSVRLFLNWGEGLKAQHMDMDLSCRVLYENGEVKDCAYYNLFFEGARHSGDIREIPDFVGTAEYVELDLDVLAGQGAKWAVFTSNAYSLGELEANLKVGWMDSAYPMSVTGKGVAYDPSCVQRLARIPSGRMIKGLLFGALDIGKREIVWMDVPFEGQIAKQLSIGAVQAYIQKLRSKLTLGRMLEIMAGARGLEVVKESSEATAVYDRKWALEGANVIGMLFS